MLTNQFTRLAYRRYRMTNGFPFRLSSVPLRFRFHFVLSPIRFLLLFCSIANTAGPVGGSGGWERDKEREGWGNGRRVYCYTRLHLTLPKFKSLMQSLSAPLSAGIFFSLSLPLSLFISFPCSMSKRWQIGPQCHPEHSGQLVAWLSSNQPRLLFSQPVLLAGVMTKSAWFAENCKEQ